MSMMRIENWLLISSMLASVRVGRINEILGVENVEENCKAHA